MSGLQGYNAAYNAVVQRGENERAELRAMRDRRVRQQAGNALAGGDYGGAANALFQGGDLQSGLAVQNAQSTRQTADRERQRSALAAAASGLLYVPAEQRAAMFQNTIAPRLIAEGVPQEIVSQITPDVLSDQSLRGFVASMGGEVQNAPSGYQWEGQNLRYIPGGPEDPRNQRPIVTPYGIMLPPGAQLPQGMGQPAPQGEVLDALPQGARIRPRPNQAPSAPAAGGAERNQPVSVSFRNSGDARSAVQQLVPGVRVTSADRTQADQARLRRQGYRPSDTSFHLQGRALDLTPPAGMSMGELAAKMRRAGFRVLDEGHHVHVSW